MAGSHPANGKSEGISQVVKCIASRTYRGYVIRTIVQPSGRKTYDIYEPGGDVFEWAHESLAVARAVVDAHVD